ncbi:hypothetical protein FOQG_17364 [Fusarium oxysporum f. sp. raphani 54005]|uniref:Uncharacterized protein n=1 Tax=Fusarium oxysporum f. sp. raphani 54005 TaxID=1089458 RepID=X0BHH6_FUSOX|nr:hypothetical protein FOQG_17364 [Fusarium oxysporum f. sp. raphani 54005]
MPGLAASPTAPNPRSHRSPLTTTFRQFGYYLRIYIYLISIQTAIQPQ